MYIIDSCKEDEKTKEIIYERFEGETLKKCFKEYIRATYNNDLRYYSCHRIVNILNTEEE